METMTKEKMVIYKEGKGCIQDVLIESPDGILRSQYSGHTLEEYNALNGGGFVVMTLDEACDKIGALEDEKYIKQFVEISEDEYMEMLECLPPQKWQTVEGVNIFRMMEYMTGNITAHYVKYNGKFFCANRRTSTAYSEIVREIKAI